jgi:hypothetical protein
MLQGCQKSWDQHSTIIFPFLFSTFNVIYWMYFLSVSVYRA